MKPAVFLTFDDFFVDQWVAALPIFERYDAKATFFPCNIDTFNKSQLEGLKILENAGHTVGCHSLRHEHASIYVQTHTLQEYWDNDIEPALKLMHEAGLDPRCFAYPSNRNNDEIDAMMLQTFERLRSGVHCDDVESIFIPADEIANRGLLLSTGIDSDNKAMPVSYVCDIMRKVKECEQCVVFYSHNIAEESEYHYTTPDRLESILKYGRSIGLDFYGFDDIC